MEFSIRADRKPQGARKLVHEREEDFRLMDQGLSSREACKMVGIHERTARERRGQQLRPAVRGER
jgi:uncharacterized protein YoaH (UPF0181 family)